jgi:ferredoxin
VGDGSVPEAEADAARKAAAGCPERAITVED